jgi:hypothetical protein
LTFRLPCFSKLLGSFLHPNMEQVYTSSTARGTGFRILPNRICAPLSSAYSLFKICLTYVVGLWAILCAEPFRENVPTAATITSGPSQGGYSVTHDGLIRLSVLEFHGLMFCP